MSEKPGNRVTCLVSVSIPGTSRSLYDDPHIRELKDLLAQQSIESSSCHIARPWGCLKQIWMVFICPVDTSGDWYRPLICSESEWQNKWLPLFDEGKLLMQVHSRTESGDRLADC